MKRFSTIILLVAILFAVSCKKQPKIPARTISLLDGKVTFEIPDDERVFEFMEFRTGIDMYNVGVLATEWKNENFKTCEPEAYSPLLMDLIFADGRTLVPEHVLEMLENYNIEENEEFAIIRSRRFENSPRKNYLRSSYTKIKHNGKAIGECLFKINKPEFKDGEVYMNYEMDFLVDDNLIHINPYITSVKAEEILAACPEFLEKDGEEYRFKSPQAMDEFYALLESGETKRMPEILQLLHTTKEMVLSTLTIKD